MRASDNTLARIGNLAAPTNRFRLREMVRASLKKRHHKSLLGVLWDLLGPLAMLLVLYVVFRRNFGNRVQAYPVYLMAGIVVVGFFAAASQHMVTLFERIRDLMQNSSVPAEAALAANIAPHALRLGIEMLLCLALAGYYGEVAWWGLVLVLPLLASLVGLAVGVGLVLGILYTVTQDVEHMWLVAARLLFFVTPVFYDLESLGPTARNVVYWANPLTPVLMAMRSLLIQPAELSVGVWVQGTLTGVVVLAAGYAVYLSCEDWVAENA